MIHRILLFGLAKISQILVKLILGCDTHDVWGENSRRGTGTDYFKNNTCAKW